MPQNKMIDLQNYLFEEMDRLNDPEIMEDPEKAKAEIARAKAMGSIGSVMVNNCSNAIKATKLTVEHHGEGLQEMPLLEAGKDSLR